MFHSIFLIAVLLNIYFGQVTKVTDGDTFRVHITLIPQVELNTNIRVRGIDTPEIHGKCDKEKKLALEAKQFTEVSLKSVDNFIKISELDGDKFSGRYDAKVIIGEESLADMLISKGYAVKYLGFGPKKNWCE